MKKFVYAVFATSVVLFFLISCLEDDNEIILYDDVALTKFGITFAYIESLTQGSDGSDSAYYASFEPVSYYPFSIDQQLGLVYNVDSLPLGVDPSRMLCTYGTKNSALPYVKDLLEDSWTLLQTTDTLDFTTARTLMIVSSDGTALRTYSVSVNIHNEDGDEFKWIQHDVCSEFFNTEGIKAIAVKDTLVIFSTDGTQTQIFRTSLEDANNWTMSKNSFSSETFDNVVVYQDMIYILDGAKIKQSNDCGDSFVTVADVSKYGIKKLFGASKTEIYAFMESGLIATSKDGGISWEADQGMVDNNETDYLPSQDISFCTKDFEYNDNTEYVMLVGNRNNDQDKNAVVWRKIIDNSEGADEAKWIYVLADDSNPYPLPRLKGLTVANMDDVIIALGQEGIGACSEKAFTKIYESKDGGITWKENSSMSLPSEFNKNNVTSFDLISDINGNIWIVCGGSGEVWQGKLNRLAWQEQ